MDAARRADDRDEEQREEADPDPPGRTPRDRGHIETEDEKRGDGCRTEPPNRDVHASPFADLLERARAPQIGDPDPVERERREYPERAGNVQKKCNRIEREHVLQIDYFTATMAFACE